MGSPRRKRSTDSRGKSEPSRKVPQPRGAEGDLSSRALPGRENDVKILEEASRVFNSSLDIQKTFEMIARLVSRKLGDTCGIFKVEGSKLQALTVFSKGKENSRLKTLLNDTPLPLKSTATGYCVQKKEPLFIPDASRDARIMPFFRDWLKVRSYIAVPLVAKKKVLGVLSTTITGDDLRFNDNDFRLIIAIADRAAVSLENALLYEKAKSQTRRLSVVDQILVSINSSLDLENVYETIVEQLKGVLPFPFLTNIALYQPEDDAFVFSHIYDPTGTAQEILKVGRHYPGESLMLSRAFREKKTRYVRDARRVRTKEEFRKRLVEKGILSFLNLPLIVEQECIGTLNIASFDVQSFKKEEIALLETLSRHLAIAINNARVYDELRGEVRDRKRAEEKAAQSVAEWETTFNSFSEPVGIHDGDFKLIRVNKAYAETFGMKSGELLGKTCCEIINRRSAPMPGCLLKQVRETRSPGTEEMYVSRMGTYLELSSAPIFDDKGEISSYVNIIKDITERKQAQIEIQNNLDKLRASLGRIIDVIALTVESKDPYTAGHQRRSADLARAIAREMGLPPERVDGIRTAGVIHDLGKLIIPSEILSKPGGISEIEFNLIKTHPRVGYDILKDIEFPWPVAQIVLQHHEKINGTGYPLGLYGKDIILEAKILAVADVVEAMASHRPYRPSLGMQKALDEITNNRGVLYDSNVVDACLRCITEREFAFRDASDIEHLP